MKYAALLRGINVGGNNKISMAELRTNFENLGYYRVRTYINSGNVIFEASDPAKKIAQDIEADLLVKFPNTTMPIKTLVLSKDQMADIVKKAPEGFGSQPGTYHSDVLFLIDLAAENVMPHLELHPEVDTVWPGDGVIYFQRVSALRTKSRLGKIISKPVYKSITIRNWNTTHTLLNLMESAKQ